MCKANPRKVFETTLLDIGNINNQVLAVSCDSAKGAGMASFIKRFPDRYVEVGISEQNAVSICAGLAELGYIPVIAVITPFLTMRAYEQVRNDIGYANANVKLVGSGGGLAYSTLGSSHEAIEDISVMRTIPNMTILCPGDGYEVDRALRLAIEHNGPVYIRMPRHALEDLKEPKSRNVVIGESETIVEGNDILIIATGTMVKEAKDAAIKLNEVGISASVESFMTVKPINKVKLIALCRRFKAIFTVEEHSKIGGLGSSIAEILVSEEGIMPLHILGVEEGSKLVGPYREVLCEYGLTGNKIAEIISKTFSK
jgi:transketolase